MEVASKLFLRHENPGKCAFEFLDASVSPSWVSDTYIRILPLGDWKLAIPETDPDLGRHIAHKIVSRQSKHSNHI